MNLFNLLSGEITQKDLLNYYNATIDYVNMPNKINGFVFYYNEIYIIAVNKNLSYYKRKKTILHELAHIELNQLNQIDYDAAYLKVNNYEDEADRYIKIILESIRMEAKIVND